MFGGKSLELRPAVFAALRKFSVFASAAARRAACVFALLALAGCGGPETLRGRVIDYGSDKEQGRQPLQYPPNLVGEGGAQGAAASTYSIYRLQDVQTAEVAALPENTAIIYHRRGLHRWLEAPLPARVLWPRLRDFWRDLGFALEVEDEDIGVLETEWLENRARARGVGITGTLDNYLDRLWDTGERDKYVMRLEDNGEDGTLIFLSHRAIAARFGSGERFVGYQRLPPDPQLEAAVLRRLLLWLNVSEGEADAVIARGEAEAEAEENQSHFLDDDGAQLVVRAQGATARRRLTAAMDRAGFAPAPEGVAAQHKEDGNLRIPIRYAGEADDPDIVRINERAANDSLLGRLFGGDAPPTQLLYLHFAEEDGGATRISVRDAGDDSTLRGKTARAILTVLADNLDGLE